MGKLSKRQTASSRQISTQKGSTARPSKQVEAYLWSREILRRIRRTSLLFGDVPDKAVRSTDRLH